MPETTPNPAPIDPGEYWEGRLSKDFSLHTVGWLGLGQSYNEWLYKVRAHVFRRVVRGLKIDLATARILDIGSGTGFYVDLWDRLGARSITGSDVTEVSVTTLAGRFPKHRFVRMDVGAEQVPLEADAFDAASAFDVLFHIVDDERYARAMRNIYGALKPGGWFVFSDNFLHHGSLRAAHQASRSLQEITDAVSAAGFEIIRRRPMFMQMMYPVDSTDKELQARWQAGVAPARKDDAAGDALGRKRYRREILRVRFAKESPTTEYMLCRKPLSR